MSATGDSNGLAWLDRQDKAATVAALVRHGFGR